MPQRLENKKYSADLRVSRGGSKDLRKLERSGGIFALLLHSDEAGCLRASVNFPIRS